MPDAYAAAMWTVKDGKEEEFVGAWEEAASWTVANYPQMKWLRLLRDSQDPKQFLSVGPWESPEAVEGWRTSPEFQERIGRLRELADNYEPRTMTVASTQRGEREGGGRRKERGGRRKRRE